MARRPTRKRLTNKQILDALIQLFEPSIRNAFLISTSEIVDNVHLTSLIEHITNGQINRAFDTLGISPAVYRPLNLAIENAYERGGVMTGQTFPKFLNTSSGRVVFRFDIRNSRAEAWLREKSSGLINRLTEEARFNTQSVLQNGMLRGQNPRTVALDLVGRIDRTTGLRNGGVIGLGSHQLSWVKNVEQDLNNLSRNYFQRELRDKRFDSIVLKAINDGKNLSADQIEKLVSRYKNKALRHRAENVARTEAVQALNHSEWEATKQAVDLGATLPENVIREWDSAGDIRVRFSHKELDGQKRGIDEPFKSPVTKDLLMFPGDSSLGASADETNGCRCRVRTTVDWLAQVE